MTVRELMQSLLNMNPNTEVQTLRIPGVVITLCRHESKVKCGSDPEGDIQFRCQICGHTWWWP